MRELLAPQPKNHAAQFETLLVNLLRDSGWQVIEHPGTGEKSPDIIAEHAGRTYVFEVKRSAEGRRDRVIPLVAQAILQVRKLARGISDHPIGVAIVVANYMPESVSEHVKNFAREYAPDVGVGLLDLQGFRSFQGWGLERFNSEPPSGRDVYLSTRAPSSPHLFSDLNQWMLKVLLARSIPESYLTAPRGRHHGASDLARAAGVSVMTAFRFIEQFTKEGFLEQEYDGLRLVRKNELMNQWLAANQRKVPEIAARWILHKGKDALWEALRAYKLTDVKLSSKVPESRRVFPAGRRPRVCLGLFAAAEALGLGFVHGVRPYLYVERAEQDVFEDLGLSKRGAEQHPDVYIRIPQNRESVFRGIVVNDGVPACDILQVWLDVSQHPVRGREQGNLIWRTILAPALIDKDER